MLEVIDNIGFWGPIILLCINTVEIWSREIYFISYLAFFGVSSLVNTVLKQVMRGQRPANQLYLNKFDISAQNVNIYHHRYGMPSGHAQSTGYSIAYLYLMSGSTVTPSVMISMFIGALTLYQRYVYNRHTLGQLAVGLAVGSSIAVIAYESAYMYKTGNYKNVFA